MNWSPTKITKLVLVLACVWTVAGLVVFRQSATPALKPSPPVVPTPLHDLVQKDGRWFHLGATNPFSGLMVDYYPGDVALRSRCQITNGLLCGIAETWYTNGQLEVREHYQEGMSGGLREKWYPDGNKLSQATIVEGKVTGTFRRWYDNGKLAEQIEMKHGLADGVAWAYFPSGCLEAQILMKDGRVLDRKEFKEGQRNPSATP